MRVLFATAELAPLVKVGGLGDFSAGFTRALSASGAEVEIVLPDYGGFPIEAESRLGLEVPAWCSPATVETTSFNGAVLTLVTVPEMERPNPYVDDEGRPWPDNERRFLGFSAAVAAWMRHRRPDVVHLNDWHTAAVPAFLDDLPPSLITIHNLAYQGNTDGAWLDLLPHHAGRFELEGETNPLAGGISLADRVVAVSPNFVTETLPPNDGFGLSRILANRGDAYSGILNGIDTNVWDPGTDQYLGKHYDSSSIEVKDQLKADLASTIGIDIGDGPLVGMVTRLTDQKGVDIALEAFESAVGDDGSMVLLGSGERDLADMAEAVGLRHYRRFHFRNGYDEELAHRIFAASDLYLMPSRFEPAGLTQMQAMRYGAIPVVTDVGGLHDTVVDADTDPDRGTGFVASGVSAAAVADALTRAIAAWRSPERRAAIVTRGMGIDWSWDKPAHAYLDLYAGITSAR